MSDADPTASRIQRVIADAIEDARDGTLESARLASVRQLLLTNPEARRFYLEYNRLSHLLTAAEITLAEYAGTSSDRGQFDGGEMRGRQSFPKQLAFAVTAAAMALVIVFVSGTFDSPAEQASTIALLEHVDGDVMVTSVEAESRLAQSGADLISGDTIRTVGALSSVVLVYPDDTRLLVVGNTSVTCASDGQKSIVVHGGTVSASVSPQPVDAPMLLATPQDRVEVLGTKFVLDARSHQTDISVNQGRIKLTRLSDGHSVEVPAGQRVVSSAESTLTPEKIPTAPVDWSVDFEDGLPAHWQTGKFVTTDLPAGSRGAVQADRLSLDGRVLFNIVTSSNWPYGLFAVHEDSHLHFTFKMDQPGWIDIIVCTRTVDGDPPAFSSNYIFNDRSWIPTEAGNWFTVSIPLSEFRRAAADSVAMRYVIPFSLVFSSPDGDRSLVIDRMWVTRGGPGEVRAEKIE